MHILILICIQHFITEYKLVQSVERGFAEKVPQLTVKGVGLVIAYSNSMYTVAK